MNILTKTTGTGIVLFIVMMLFAQCMSDQKKLEAAAKLFNKTAPVEVGGVVRLEKMEALPEKNIKIHVTMYDNNDMMGIVDPKLMSQSMGAQMKRMVATSSEMKSLRDMSVTFIFNISTDKGHAFDEIIITPEDYNNPDISKPIDNDDLAAQMQLSIDAVKKNLPFTEPTTGITITDMYTEGNNTLVSVQELPDDMLDNTDKEVFIVNTKENVISYMTTNPAMKALIDKGIIIKYIYKTTKGATYAEIIITKDDL